MKIIRHLVWLGLLASICCARVWAGDWQIIRVQDRDYLSVANVAAFYQLHGDMMPADGKINVTDGRNSLSVSGDPREITVNGVKQWLSFPLVNKDGQYLISRFDLAKTVEPALRPTMISNLPSFHTVVLDAGHGGGDRGANSTVGFEKDYTLDVVHDLKSALEAKGLQVQMTRDGDTFIPLDGRAKKVNDIKDAIFVSVHFNSANDGGAANGFEVFAMTPQGAASTGDETLKLDQLHADPGNDFDNASLALATCVHSSLLGHLPEGDRGVKRARFAVLRLSHAPSVLVEGGFLTNPSESQEINSGAWRRTLAESIAQGVQSFQTLAVQKQSPKLLADYRSERLPLQGILVDPAALASGVPVGLSPLLPASNSSAPVPAQISGVR